MKSSDSSSSSRPTITTSTTRSTNQLSRWIIEHFDKEDYIELYDYIVRCDPNQLDQVMELCNRRIHDFKALAKLTKTKTSERLRVFSEMR